MPLTQTSTSPVPTATEAAPVVAAPAPGRALGLDALRGFAILTMVLSGVIPYGVLPGWMYHAQVPPPDHVFDPTLRGITWVDLVFPFFLFALGAALPLALGKRRERGASMHRIVGHVLGRGALLGFFAIFLQHIRPYALDPSPGASTWGVALAGFAAMMAIFTRLPRDWPAPWRWSLRAVGWGGALLLLATLTYPDGTGFSLYRSDIILVVLANVAVVGALIWLVTAERWRVRLGVLGLVLAVRLAAAEPGWVQAVYEWTPVPWIYKMYYLNYLLLVLPGTFAGDLLRRVGVAGGSAGDVAIRWDARRLWSLASWGIVVGIVAVVGLYARWLVPTTLGLFALVGLGLWLTRQPATEAERLLRDLVAWGGAWLVLGLVFEPYEGGIRKDHQTVSYHFVTAGLATFALVTFTVIGDLLGRRRALDLLVANGQNPMIAYVGIMNLVLPLFALVGLDALLEAWTSTPWLGALRGLGYTLLLALLVRWFTRRGIIWRT